MKKIEFAIMFTLLLSACGQIRKEETATKNGASGANGLAESIIGTWTNVTLKVIVKNVDGDSVIHVPEGRWEEILQIKPIITEIKGDSTFTSSYYNLNDELMMTSSGSWSVKGDSLTMVQNGQATSYHTVIDGGLVTFTGYLDWDQDGERDDLYFGTQRSN